MPGTIPSITDPILVDASSRASSDPLNHRPVTDGSELATGPSEQGANSSNATLTSPFALEHRLASTSVAAQSSASTSPESIHLSVTSDPSAPSLVSPVPLAHPTSGVASKGAAQLVASTSLSSALAPTNLQANMNKQLGNAELRQRSAAAGKKRGAALTEEQKKDTELLKFIETEGHFSLVRNFHLADAFTLMNAFCGAQSLFASGRYLLTSDPKHAWLALWFPLFGAIFDLLDGKVARWRKSSSMLGQELDSLADSLSFGAAPAFAAYSLGLRLPFDSLLLTLFVCAGVARLARFNVTAASVPHDSTGKARYFEGLPIPSSLVLVGGMALCLLTGRVEAGGLPIPLARERGYISEKGLTFTGSLKGYLPDVLAGGRGVPLGIWTVDVSQHLERALGVLPLGSRTAREWSQCGVVQGHWISLLWAAWAMAMVSKTLRVPKP